MRAVTRIGSGIVAAVGLADAMLVPLVPAGAASPNNSLLFYRSSGSPTAFRATVNGGVYVNRGPQALATGFTRATFSLTRQIHFTGVTTVAASCDTVLAYDASNGFATAAQVSGGSLIGLGNNYNFDPHWTTITATDDSALFYTNGSANGSTATLSGGVYEFHGAFGGVATNWALISGGK